MDGIVDIGGRLELLTDRLLVAEMAGTAFQLHPPQPAPPADGTLRGDYMTVFQDGQRFRAYFRRYDPSYTGECFDGNEGEYTDYAESDDGIAWRQPELGQYPVNGSRQNSAVLRLAPYSHNFAPFRDARPAGDPRVRYRALAGTHAAGAEPGSGLHAFHSPDGLRWERSAATAVFDQADFAFDSQNVSFWSEAEGRYVCYFRSWQTPHGSLRTISRTTSEDYLHWSEPVAMAPNLPGEHLYTSQTHPYFRAPHLYVALPTRFHPERGESTDILFMTARAGAASFDRLFTEAFIRPGLDPQRWGNRSNYAACGVLPTGPAEMSLYHGPSGRRYALRTDGFISVHAGADRGRMTTRLFTFTGSQLTLNLSTSAAGGARVELQDARGIPLPGRSLAECPPIYTDAIAHAVRWREGSDLSMWAGTPVRLRIELQEADLYAIQFMDASG